MVSSLIDDVAYANERRLRNIIDLVAIVEEELKLIYLVRSFTANVVGRRCYY